MLSLTKVLRRAVGRRVETLAFIELTLLHKTMSFHSSVLS